MKDDKYIKHKCGVKNPYKNTFLYRCGYHVQPCKEFIKVFKEEFEKILKKRKNIKKYKITTEDARYMIICICEAIIHCLDFGISILIPRFMRIYLKNFTINKKAGLYRNSSVENMKTIVFKLTSLSIRRRSITGLNKDNLPFLKYYKKRIQDGVEYMRYTINKFHGDGSFDESKLDLEFFEKLDGYIEDNETQN